MRLLAFALLLSCVLPAEAFAGYTQRLHVQVFDQDYRPVEGAQVYVEHQLNSVYGKTRTKPKPTAANGTVDLLFTNYEEITASTDSTYTLYVKYGTQVKSSTLTASETNAVRIYSMEVGAYYAFVRVRDQEGRALGATVTIGNASKKTDNMGEAAFQLPTGTYTAKAEVNHVVRNKDLMLNKDQVVEIAFPFYNLTVFVTDDRKRPLAAQVELDGSLKNTSEEGNAFFENITNEQPKLVVRYNESFKKLQPNLKNDNSVTVVFDLTKPTVAEMHHTIEKNGEVTVNAFVQEIGSAASGISGVSITYEVKGVTSQVPAYTVGYNSFEAKIPVQPKDTLVKYTVKVSDREGNAGFATGTYTIASEKKVVETKKEDPGFFGIKLGLETIAIIILALGIAAYGALYYLKKKKHAAEIDDGLEVPPQNPPASPPSA